jgi:hypothetical protein
MLDEPMHECPLNDLGTACTQTAQSKTMVYRTSPKIRKKPER